MPSILIIDDEPDNVELLARRLSRRGYDILTAFSAEDGIMQALQKKPDLILMDIKMPVMDGFAAIAHLRQLPETKTMPIIALTAHAMQEDREKALQVGADEYESKPVDLASLIEKMQLLLTRSSEATSHHGQQSS